MFINLDLVFQVLVHSMLLVAFFPFRQICRDQRVTFSFKHLPQDYARGIKN